MKKRFLPGLFLAFLLAFPDASRAAVGIGIRAGTTGVGGEAAFELVDEYLNFRVAGNGGVLGVKVNQDDATYDTELKLHTWLAVLDWHVGGGPFKIVAGACYNGTKATGAASPTGPIDVGDMTFTPAQIGSLHAEAGYNAVGGYLGIGFGNLAASRHGHWSASMDLGVMVFSSPELTLESRGGTFSNTPVVQEQLRRELDQFSDDYIKWLRYYPVLTLGVAIRF